MAKKGNRPDGPGSTGCALSPGLRDDFALCRSLIAHTPYAILLADLDGRIVESNPAACELLGYSVTDLCGRHLADVESVSPERLEDRWVRIAAGAPLVLESVYNRKDGAGIPVELRLRFVEVEGRRFILTVAADITHRRERAQTEEALRESEERFRCLVEHSGDAYLLVDRQGCVADANRHACENLGYTRDELLGLRLSEVDGAMVRSRVGHLWKEITPGLPVIVEATHHRKDGSTYPAEQRVGLLRSGEHEFMLFLVRDLSEQHRVQSELRSSNQQLKGWVEELEHRSRQMGQVNELGELLQVCQSPREAYRVISRSAHILFPGDAGAVYVLDASRSVLESVATWGEAEPTERVFGPDDCWALRRGRLHIETRRAGGLVCPHVTGETSEGYLCMPMVGQGETMGLLHLRFANPDTDNTVGRHLRGTKERLAVTIADQISLALANLNLRETLRTQAIRDPLTGLFNRRYMEESLERELHRATRKGVPLGLIMLDIDHFKRVNDSLGHAAGDAVLREFGAFLRAQVRGEDIACRYGGEEFVLILLDSNLEHTRQRAEGLRENLAGLDFQTRQEGLGPITASLGVAAVPEHGAGKQTLLGAADGALYVAKREGRDRVCVAQVRT